MSEEIVLESFEQLWGVPDQAQAGNEKPALGPHRFTVKSSTFFEDSNKWSVLLVNKEGAAIWKKSHMADASKASKNKEWLVALFAEKPNGRLVDFNWSACEGKLVDATVGSFTPQDREEPIWFVNQPQRCNQPAGQAPVARETRDQKAKSAMSKDMLNDVPF